MTVLVIVGVFREDLRVFLRRVLRIKFPGGELSTQASRESHVDKDREPPEVDTSEADLPAGVHLTPENEQRLRDFIQAERTRATLWEYRYLGYYLAPGTQRVLDWLATLPQQTSVHTFDALFSPIILNAEERKAILAALANHHLIQLVGDLIEVTPKGREYIQWRGPLPKLPKAE